MRKFIGLTALVLLGACSNVDWAALESQMQFANLETEAAPTVDESYGDLPFDSGVVYVVAHEHGDLHTYSLTPCGGTGICGANGRIGHVERTVEYFIVRGA